MGGPMRPEQKPVLASARRHVHQLVYVVALVGVPFAVVFGTGGLHTFGLAIAFRYRVEVHVGVPTPERELSMADIGKPKRKIKIEPEPRRREDPHRKAPAPDREQPAKEPVPTGTS